MRGFNKPTGETVTFTRGEQSLSITFYPLPMGFHNWLTKAFPVPRRYLNGEAVPASPGVVNEWNDLATLILIAKSAEDGTFETAVPTGTAAEGVYRARAIALRDEVRGAHFGDGDIRAMWAVVKRLTNESSVGARMDAAAGNS